MDPFAPDDREATPQTQEYPLASGSLPVLQPILIGLMVGFSIVTLLSIALPEISETVLQMALLGISLAMTAVATFFARRRLPDRVRITSEAVEFARGKRAVSRIRLSRLAEVDEFESASGKVLFLSDDRQTLALVSAQLVEPRQYGNITAAIVDTVRRLDPSGRVARGALESARLREVLARKPMRGTFILTGVITAASIMSLSSLHVLRFEPFPAEDIGALSKPLLTLAHPDLTFPKDGSLFARFSQWFSELVGIVPTELFRLVSYVFIHANIEHLVMSMIGLLWLGGFLEKLVGWERLIVCFFAGVLSGALGQVLLSNDPSASVGSGGGLFGLIGLLIAVALVARRMPRAIRPKRSFIFLAVLLGFMLMRPSSYIASPLSPLGHLVAFTTGLVLGLITLIGTELPLNRVQRREWRWFANFASFALIVGLIGGVTHHSRASHRGDASVILRGYIDLPQTLDSAHLQNALAYTKLMSSTDKLPPETLLVAERLASEAVDNSNREDPAILDTLAVARYKQGNKEDAETLLMEALKLPYDRESREAKRGRALIERHLQDVKADAPLRLDSN